MFLRIYKTNRAYLILLIPLTALLFWLPGFIVCDFDTFIKSHSISMPLYKMIEPLVNYNCYVSRIITIILALTQAFYLAYLNKNFFFIKQRTYLHALIFLLIVSSNTITQYAGPALFANFFILFSINELFKTFKSYKPNKQLFNAGIFLSIGGLFYLNTFLLLPLIIVAYLILNSTKFREILVIITGIITPLIIITSILFINNILGSTIENVWNYITTINYNFDTSIYNYFFYGWLILLLFISFLSFSKNIGTKKISSRKYLSIFLVLVIYNIVTYFLLAFSGMEIIIITAAPIALIMTDFYVNVKNSVVIELSFAVLIVAFILLQLPL